MKTQFDFVIHGWLPVQYQTELALAFKMAAEMSAKKIMQRTQLSFVYCFQRTAHVSSYRFGNSTELAKTPNSREDTIDHRS